MYTSILATTLRDLYEGVKKVPDVPLEPIFKGAGVFIMLGLAIACFYFSWWTYLEWNGSRQKEEGHNKDNKPKSGDKSDVSSEGNEGVYAIVSFAGGCYFAYHFLSSIFGNS